MRSKTPLWRSTPPAIFPVALGFMGLGLAWRNAASVTSLPHEIGDLLLGLSTAFLIYFLALYFLKALKRPAVVWEDMKTAPGRAGVAALPMALMLLTAALLPFNVAVPVVWWTGVALQALVILLGALSILSEAKELRGFTPFQYLSFVGPVVAPLAGVPLGFIKSTFALLIFSQIAWVVISAGCLLKLLRVRPPPPLRPALAIALAATSLMAIGYGMLGVDTGFDLFYGIAWALALALLAAGPWMMQGGWSPVWGAFTFPVATFTNMQYLALGHGHGGLALAGLWAGLILGTPLILYIVYRALMAFVQGALAEKSAAAIA